MSGAVSYFAWSHRAVKPKAAQRRAEGAGFKSEGADQAITAIQKILFVAPTGGNVGTCR
jgi:hypothetical protein